MMDKSMKMLQLVLGRQHRDILAQFWRSKWAQRGLKSEESRWEVLWEQRKNSESAPNLVVAGPLPCVGLLPAPGANNCPIRYDHWWL